MRRLSLTLFLISSALFAEAQMMGNMGYNSNYYARNSDFKEKINYTATDSCIVIESRVLMSKLADKYIITLSLSNSDENLNNSYKNIDKKISAFLDKVSKSGIKNKSYVDFISQIMIFEDDYDKSKDEIEQKPVGFEVRKNIVLEVYDQENVDNIFSLAAGNEIYNISNIEYVNNDVNAIYNKLFEESMILLKDKKNRYSQAFGIKLEDIPFHFSENFKVISPQSLYNEFEARESSSYLSNKNTNRKIVRKDKAMVYNYLSAGTVFDKIIEDNFPAIGLYYTLNINIVYKKVK